MSHEREEYKKTAEGVFLSALAANFQLFLQFFTIILLTRYLTVRDYGVYSFVFATITLLGFFSSLALFSITRFVPDFLASRQIFLAKRLVRFALKYTLVISVIIAICFFLYPDIFNTVSRDNAFSPRHIHIFFWIILFTLLSEVLDITLIAQIEIRYRVVIRTVYTALTLVLTGLSLHLGFGLKGVLWVQAGALALLFSMSYGRVQKTLFALPDAGGRQLEMGTIIRYCVFAQLGLMGDLFTSLTIDIYLISIWLGSRAVGEFTFGIKIPQTIITNSPAVLGAAVVLPYIIRQYTQTGRKENLSLFFSFYTKFTAFLTLPILFGMTILSGSIIRTIFNPEYISSLPVFIFSTLYFTIFSFRSALIPVYNTLKKPDIGFYAKLVFLASTGINIYLLSKGHGITAVIKVGIVAIFVTYIMELILTNRRVPLHLPWASLAKIFLSSTVMGTSLLGLRGFVRGAGSLTFLIILGTVIYFLTSLLIKPFAGEDRTIMEKAGSTGLLLRYFRRDA